MTANSLFTLEQSSSAHSIAPTCCSLAIATQFFREKLAECGITAQGKLCDHFAILLPVEEEEEQAAHTSALLSSHVPDRKSVV